MFLLITGFSVEVRSGIFSFERDVKVLTVCKTFSIVNETVFMASNRGTGPLKLSYIKWIRPMGIVMDGFGKKDPPVRKKLPTELDIPEWF